MVAYHESISTECTRKYVVEYITAARHDAFETVRQEVSDAINKVRENQQIDIVIENYISASKDVDITQDVIQYLDDNYQKEQLTNSSQQQTEEK